MLFSPGSMQHIYELVSSSPTMTALVECRDLPESWDAQAIVSKGPDWKEFQRIGKLRGRWGMGGMIAVTRNVYDRLRGLDERMHTYGCEDIDFGERTQRAGNFLYWIEDPNVRMYHMWHEHAREAVDADPEIELAVANNRKILFNDKSFVRNSTAWHGRLSDSRPIVSVVIATRNRGHLISDSIYSVLSQTVQDFEIVVVIDGSADCTEDVLRSIDDDRIRMFSQEQRGIAAARNRGVDESKGYYIAVLDDDDLMPPWRLESQLASITEGMDGSYGAFVNFNNEDGALKLFSEKDMSVTTAYHRGGAPGHSTWLVSRDLFKLVRYDESIISGEDNNLFLRWLRLGFKFAHCGDVVALRRTHDLQITKNDNGEHESVAARNRYYLRFLLSGSQAQAELDKQSQSEPWVKTRGHDRLSAMLSPYFPDHLVGRVLLVNGDELMSESQAEYLSSEMVGVVVLRPVQTQPARPTLYLVPNGTLESMALLRKRNIPFVTFVSPQGIVANDLQCVIDSVCGFEMGRWSSLDSVLVLGVSYLEAKATPSFSIPYSVAYAFQLSGIAMTMRIGAVRSFVKAFESAKNARLSGKFDFVEMRGGSVLESALAELVDVKGRKAIK